jgi:plasmid stability protein
VKTRNITLSLPDHLVKRARVIAAERDMSVSALVRELLERAEADDDDYSAVWAAESQAMRRGIGLTLGPADWGRDEIHSR